MKLLIILTVVLCCSEPLTASVVMSKGSACGGKYYHETWYLGSNEQEFRYHKHGGGHVDDGLFVAIHNDGPYGGYSYYELKHPVTGIVDGGPAYLPNDPGSLPVTEFKTVAKGYGSGNQDGFLKTWRGGVPELPDGSVIPIGSKFFYWMSRGGKFSLTASILEPKIEKEKVVHVEEILMKIENLEEALNLALEEPIDTQEVVEELVLNINELEDILKDLDSDENEDSINSDPASEHQYEL